MNESNRIKVGDIILANSCNPFRIPKMYEAEVVSKLDNGYELIDRVTLKVRPIKGLFKHSRWIEWFQIEGIVQTKDVRELESLIK